MKKMFVAILLIFSASADVAAQGRRTTKARPEVRLDKTKPPIFISFESAGVREPLRDGESNQGVWLRLNNNTKWTIIFPAFGVPKLYGDAGMYYEIETTPIDKIVGVPSSEAVETPIGYRLSHAYSTYYLSPGGSVTFSVPREHLTKHFALRISYSYEWEDRGDVSTGRGPRHFVFFQASSLPQNIQ